MKLEIRIYFWIYSLLLFVTENYLGAVVFPCGDKLEGCERCVKENKLNQDFYECTECMSGLFLFQNSTQSGLKTTVCVEECSTLSLTHTNDISTSKCRSCGNHCQRCHPLYGCLQCHPSQVNSKLSVLTSHPLNAFSTNPKFKICTSCQGLVKFKNNFPCKTCEIQAGTPVCLSTLDQCSNLTETHDYIDKGQNSRIVNCEVESKDGMTCGLCRAPFFTAVGQKSIGQSLCQQKCEDMCGVCESSKKGNNVECKSCVDGYEMQSQCVACQNMSQMLNPTCAQCLNGKCTKCMDGYQETTLAGGGVKCDSLVITGCHADCGTCFGGGIDQCLSCGDGKYLDGSTCKGKTNAPQILDIFVAPFNSSGLELEDGSHTRPFSDLPRAIEYAHSKAAPFTSFTIHIWLQKGTHFILPNQLNFYHPQVSTSTHDHAGLKLGIQPLVCGSNVGGQQITSKCSNPNETVKIVNKVGGHLRFKIGGELSIKNVEIDAVDTQLNVGDRCRWEKRECCQFGTQVSSVGGEKCEVPYNGTHPNCQVIDSPISMFSFKQSKSTTSSNSGKLDLNTVSLYHFFYRFDSFILISYNVGQISITNSSIINIGTCANIITNIIQTFPNTHTSEGVSISGKEASILQLRAVRARKILHVNLYPKYTIPTCTPSHSPCTSVIIHNLTINQYFIGLPTLNQLVQDANNFYGLIIDLDTYPGNFLMQHSSIKNSQIKLKSCSIFIYTQFEIFYSQIKFPFIYINLPEAPVEFISNRFESNSGFSGSLVLIHNQRQLPLVVKRNTFIQNSGGISSALVSVKDSHTCGGFLVEGNNFTQNIRCPHDDEVDTVGNLIQMSCVDEARAIGLGVTSEVKVTQNGVEYDPSKVVVRLNVYIENFYTISPLIRISGVPTIQIQSETYSSNVGNIFLQAADMYSPLKSTVSEYTKHFKPWGIGQNQTKSIMIDLSGIKSGILQNITINDPYDIAQHNLTNGKVTILFNIQFPTNSVWHINNITIPSLSGTNLTIIKRYTSSPISTFTSYFTQGAIKLMRGFYGKLFNFDVKYVNTTLTVNMISISNIKVLYINNKTTNKGIIYETTGTVGVFKSLTLTDLHIKSGSILNKYTHLLYLHQKSKSTYIIRNIHIKQIGTPSTLSQSAPIFIQPHLTSDTPVMTLTNITCKDSYINNVGCVYLSNSESSTPLNPYPITITQSTFTNIQTSLGVMYINDGYSGYQMVVSQCLFMDIVSTDHRYGPMVHFGNVLQSSARFELVGNRFVNSTYLDGSQQPIAAMINVQQMLLNNNFSLYNNTIDCMEPIKSRATLLSQKFNSANNPTPPYQATIYFQKITLNITSLTIKNCQNNYYGSIYTATSLNGKGISIINCTGYYTGGIYTNMVKNGVNIIDSYHAERLNGQSGSAYFSRIGGVKISNSRFMNSYGIKSGGFYTNNDPINSFINCTFIGNEGVEAGVFNLIIIPTNDTWFQDCVFESNIAQQGGIIVLDKSYTNIVRTKFIGNKGVTGYGAIYMIQSSLYVERSLFQGGSVMQELQGGYVSVLLNSMLVVVKSKFEGGYFTKGGGLMMDGQSDAVLVGCEMRDIRVSQVGGALYLSNVGVVTLKDTIFENCWNDKNILGGAFIFAQLNGKLVISNVSLAITKLKSNINLINLNSFHLDANQLNIDGSSNPEFTRLSQISLGGGIHLENMNSFKISNSLIKGIHGTTIGGGIAVSYHSYDLNTGIQLQIINTTIQDNQAQQAGGGLFLLRVQSILLQNTRITGNKVTNGHGGGVYYSSIKANIPISIKFTGNSSITSNIANGTGGGIKWNYYPINQLPTTITNNTATIYGNNQASYPNHIEVFSKRSLQPFLSNIQSGAQLPTIKGVLNDILEQVMKSDSSSQVTITANPTVQSNFSTILKGSTTVVISKGLFKFEGLVLITYPGSNVQLQVTTNAIDSSMPDNNDAHSLESMVKEVQVRQCVVGEQFKVTGECQKCKVDDEYLIMVQLSTGTCKPCIRDVMVCKGGSEIGPRPGYWRQSNLTDKFYQCLRPDACLGMVPPQMNPIGQCRPGFSGRLCAQCEDGYSSTGQFNCSKCPHLVWNILRMIGTLILAIICIVLLVKTTIQSAQKRKKLSSIYLKILLNHLQLIFLCSTFEFSWPKEVQVFFSTQEPVANAPTQFLSLDCFLSELTFIFGKSGTNIYFYYIAQYAILPIILIFLSIIIWRIATLKILRGNRHNFIPRTIATIIILMFLVHPSIVKIMFDSINCKKVEGKKYVQSQIQVECYSSLHLRWVLICSIPSLVIWGVGIPQLGWFVLYRNRERLNKVDVKQKYGFLFNGYKRTTYYWESVIMYRKIIVIFISVILKQSGVIVQALCVALLLVVFLIITLQFRPFSVTDLNRIESLSIFSSLITVYCGLYYLSHKPEIYNSKSQELQTADNGVRLTSEVALLLFFIILLSNCTFHTTIYPPQTPPLINSPFPSPTPHPPTPQLSHQQQIHQYHHKYFSPMSTQTKYLLKNHFQDHNQPKVFGHQKPIQLVMLTRYVQSWLMAILRYVAYIGCSF